MISLKKVYKDELLQLALILSLLRSHPDVNYENDLFNTVNQLDLDNGTSWRSMGGTLIRNHYVHPKSLDSSLMNYEAEVFADLNSLGRYNREGNIQHNRNITAYLLDHIRGEAGDTIPEQPVQDVQAPDVPELNEEVLGDIENSADNIQLSQEDMDLIKVLWMQDVDLGVSLNAVAPLPEKPEKETNASLIQSASSSVSQEDDLEKLKTLKEINEGSIKIENESDDLSQAVADPWAGLPYTIDTETGEYVIKSELEDPLNNTDLPFPFPEFIDHLLDEDSDTTDDNATSKELELLVKLSAEAATIAASNEGSIYDEEANATSSLASPASDLAASFAALETAASGSGTSPGSAEAELDLLQEMMQTSQFHHPHHRAFQGRMPFVRTMSVEQRWQDLANMLSLPNPAESGSMHQHHPFSHHHHHHHLHNFSHPHGHHHGMGAYGTDRSVLLHNATLNPPMGDLNATSASAPYSTIGGTNMGNAVATSMNLTNSSEPMADTVAGSIYKVEPTAHDMYYNSSGEFNQTDGFIASFLNDEDLLMDMALNEGMYTMRMLDGANGTAGNLSMGAPGSVGGGTAAAGNNVNAPGATSVPGGTTHMSRMDSERMDTSSDSAVSSMGSERVPSLSDGEWCDGGSDSGHTAGDHYSDYRSDYHSKYRPYDYSYSGRQHSLASGASAASSPAEASRLPPVAQKKHQMFGKRCFQDHQGTASSVLPHPPVPIKYEYVECGNATSVYTPPTPIADTSAKAGDAKYSCSLEFSRQHYLPRNHLEHVQHNHTYHLPAENTGAMQRPVSRDKAKARRAEEEHLSRDQKRARALNVPITVDDIINLPMDEFNERLSKYDLSEAQLSLIRDIRRRGKNKVAAQNCRKRKLDQILTLADEVKDMRDRKYRLVTDHDFLTGESQRIKDKYQQLYRHVFQNLRDPDGNHYSPYQYSLQTSADGSILIVPRANNGVNNPDCKERQHPGHKD
ncbi:segmentation protein cap'n'collar isoform X1 [Atheta coriaria]|uniref:segmentation protein cap'n'collar isoform X1 n=1 Tax=Dalotia coriaria TaxID=877792 RepID=UPI0031F36DE8